MGLPPRTSRVMAWGPSLIVGNEAAATGFASSAAAVAIAAAPAANPAACWRKSRRLPEVDTGNGLLALMAFSHGRCGNNRYTASEAEYIGTAGEIHLAIPIHRLSFHVGQR